jgi:hypothetical protein
MLLDGIGMIGTFGRGRDHPDPSKDTLPVGVQGGSTRKKFHAQETSQRPARSAGAIF